MLREKDFYLFSIIWLWKTQTHNTCNPLPTFRKLLTISTISWWTWLRSNKLTSLRYTSSNSWIGRTISKQLWKKGAKMRSRRQLWPAKRHWRKIVRAPWRNRWKLAKCQRSSNRNSTLWRQRRGKWNWNRSICRKRFRKLKESSINWRWSSNIPNKTSKKIRISPTTKNTNKHSLKGSQMPAPSKKVLACGEIKTNQAGKKRNC